MYFFRVSEFGMASNRLKEQMEMTGTATNQYRRQRQAGQTPVRLLLGILCLLLAAAMLPPPQAHAASTSIHVSARIRPWLDVSATPRIASYQVDAVAIKRGFIDLPNALSLRLATNLRSEIDLNLSSFGPGQVLVANGAHQGSDLLRIPALAGNQPIIRELDLRVILSSDMKEGNYPLQLSVSAMDI